MRRIAPFLLAIVVAGSLAACGSGGADSDASVSIKTLQLAAENTQAAESFRVSFSERISGGLVDVDIEGEGLQSADGARARITMSSDFGDFEVRKIDDTAYVHFGDGLGRFLTGDKSWVRVTADQSNSSGLVDRFDPSSTGIPTGALDYLRKASGDVEEIGTDQVAGRAATHYRATVKAAGATAPVDVWIDGNDRVVKLALSVDASTLDPSSAARGTVDIKVEVTDFGVAVDVEPPPAADVVDLANVIGGSGGPI